ncbi:Bifunctional oligoribonuclease and PAP phosphatase NrnA [Fundidesulfovibrio magnetotacticus]|uniref:Bifunctional oligoribonuclease and PAP phosphatase NrnA n=1 Tax=Fundidesulfovibrio magnetotacticus TaxID=2730080 RepID=A0A6V8LQ90_9BACT|nr:DHH family phosphoesterase [Fundidesulfovibrio magnetotacticus]GFK92721.1 Bifunctional oligoribonuclease and PAP phosphatase NrnA [Fundidesulfovibrio magnetotacticus]
MRDVLDALRTGSRFLVASHASPDGDAIGAMAAMGHLLKALGKEAVLYNVSGLPEHLAWLPMPGPVHAELPRDLASGGFDWIVALDCGDDRRAGKALQQAMAERPTLVIDHHIDNPRWGRVNWVETDRSSTCEMVAVLTDALGVELSGPLGQAVYLGVATDTGHFRFENASPRSMELAARLARLGLDVAGINERIENQWSLARFRLWSEVLGGLSLSFGGQLGVIRITSDQLSRLGATAADTDGLTNFVLRIRGCRVALSLREDGEGSVKLSLRSVAGVNIQPVAAAFGGGGHKGAAGATLEGGIGEIEPRVVEALSGVLGS